MIRLLAERIWGYEKILDETLEQIQERFRAWDKNLEDFPEDVKVLLQKWLDDGTLDHIINETIFNWKLDTSIFEQFRDSITAQLQQTEYGLQEQIQTLDSDLNENLNDIIKHRPIYVGEDQPPTSIGTNGSMYVQLYGKNEPQLTYSQGNTSFTIVNNSGNIIEGMETTTLRGSWLKIGELVMLDFDISFNKNNYTGANVLFRFSGLPFKPKNVSGATIAEYSGFISPYNVISINLLTGSTGVLVPRFTRVVNTDGVNKLDILGVNPSNMSDENRITGTIVYRTDEN